MAVKRGMDNNVFCFSEREIPQTEEIRENLREKVAFESDPLAR